MRFPQAVFYERLRNPDELDGAGSELSSRKLYEEGCFEFDRRLGRGSCAKHGGGSHRPKPIAAIHGRIIGRCAPAH